MGQAHLKFTSCLYIFQACHKCTTKSEQLAMYSALSQGTRQINKILNELSFQEDNSTTMEELRTL